MAKGEYAVFDHLVEELSCIRLEAGRTFTAGFCKSMVACGDYLYLMVYNEDGHAVFVYERSGRLVREIVFHDIFPLSACLVEPERKELWIVSSLRVLNRYEADGAFLGRDTLPFPCAAMAVAGDGAYLVYDGNINKEWSHSIALSSLTSVEGYFLPKPGAAQVNTSRSLFAPDAAGGCFVQLPYNDTIYYYNPETKTMKPHYHLDFHGDFLTRHQFPPQGFTDREMSEIISKRTYIHATYSFCLASGRLFFKPEGKRNDLCAIHLADHSLLFFDCLFDRYPLKTYNPFAGSDAEHLYAVVKESDLVQYFRTNASTYPAIRQLLPSLKTDGEDTVLLVIKIKE
jgi:hypothetical protein